MIVFISLVIMSRICFNDSYIQLGYYTLQLVPLFWKLIYLIFDTFLVIVAIFTYLWFKGFKFKFLKILDKFL
jgi:hypothetical protein